MHLTRVHRGILRESQLAKLLRNRIQSRTRALPVFSVEHRRTPTSHPRSGTQMTHCSYIIQNPFPTLRDIRRLYSLALRLSVSNALAVWEVMFTHAVKRNVLVLARNNTLDWPEHKNIWFQSLPLQGVASRHRVKVVYTQDRILPGQRSTARIKHNPNLSQSQAPNH